MPLFAFGVCYCVCIRVVGPQHTLSKQIVNNGNTACYKFILNLQQLDFKEEPTLLTTNKDVYHATMLTFHKRTRRQTCTEARKIICTAPNEGSFIRCSSILMPIFLW